MELNKYIDHTNLKADAKRRDILKLCNEAIEYNFASVCVHPYFVSYCKEILENTSINVCTVIGFPLGLNTTEVKVFEVEDAIKNGADEIDMVINVSALKDKKYDYLKKEISRVLGVCEGRTLKVIIETCYLENSEIIKATEICNETFVNFIKTSTGFGTGGAKTDDIKVINKVKSEILEIKASGGIKTYNDAISFIELGVTRLGTSNGVIIMEGNHEDI